MGKRSCLDDEPEVGFTSLLFGLMNPEKPEEPEEPVKTSVRQGGWWYEVTIGEDIFNVLLDVPEGTKPLKSSEIVEIYDQDGNCVNPTLDENDEVFDYIEKLLDESGLLD